MSDFEDVPEQLDTEEAAALLGVPARAIEEARD